MSRTNITKDSYLAGAESGSPASAKTAAAQPAKKPVNTLWTCTSSRNEFDGYTTYTFILKGPQNEFLFLGYDKNDVPSKSLVRAGVHWSQYWYHGTLDFKTDNKEVISKKFRSIGGYAAANWSKTKGWKGGNDEFHFSYNEGESARFFIKLFEENNYLTVRNENEVRRFQTQGFWDAVEAAGITKQEIFDAVANEEF